MSHAGQKTILRLTLLSLAFYLLLFSGFAEFHAYANNELTDAHGCQIGLWVQHGKTAVLAVVLISTALTLLSFCNPFSPTAFDLKPFYSTVLLRAPPFSLL